MEKEEKDQMTLSDWLDEKEAEHVDVSQIELPEDLYYDSVPDEIVFFKEIKPCGMFCTRNHPFSKVERFGRWYYCRGQDKAAGIHSSKMRWKLLTKDKDLAIQTAEAHLE